MNLSVSESPAEVFSADPSLQGGNDPHEVTGDAAHDPNFSATDSTWVEVDTGSLSWLLPEIGQAIEQSLKCLNDFSRNTEDTTALRMARSHLHQAHGALQVIDLEGVSLMTEVIEQLYDGFEGRPEQCNEAAVNTVAAGFRAVTEYLEELMGGALHQPMRLYPSYCELMGLRGIQEVDPGDLFFPDLSTRPPQSAQQAKALSSDEIAQERVRFEGGLLRYLRNDTDHAAVAAMCTAIATIESSPKQGQERAFWWITRAFFEALQSQALPKDVNVKRLTARINLQIRRLLDQSATVSERVLRDTLFLVAQARPSTEHIREVQRVYRLNLALPKDYTEQRYGRFDLASIRQAKEMVGPAKKAWSGVVNGKAERITEFAQYTSGILSLSSSFGQPGLSQLVLVVANIATDLSFEPRRPDQQIALDVANALLFLESALEQINSLDDNFDARAMQVVARLDAAAAGLPTEEDIPWLDEMTRKAHERQATSQFIIEIQSNLNVIEKTLDAFFRDPAQHEGLIQAEQLLTQLGAALAAMGHDQVTPAVESARLAIMNFAKENFTPETNHASVYSTDHATSPVAEYSPDFQRAAQTLSAIGFYVEHLQHQGAKGMRLRFDEASGSYTADLMLMSEVAPEVQHQNEEELPVAAVPESVPMAEASLEQETAQSGDVVTQLAEVLRENPGDASARDQLLNKLEEVRENAELIDDRDLRENASAAIELLENVPQNTDGLSDVLADSNAGGLSDRIHELASQANRLVGHEFAAVPVLPSAPVPQENDVAGIDAELLDIFLDEAQEVLEVARQAWDVLQEHPYDKEQLLTLRRAFHTLKGSGRMVGLNNFGEAAWAVEQTLNQHLSEASNVSSALLGLLDVAMLELDAWVKELAHGGHSERTSAPLVAYAEAVRDGKPYRYEPVALQIPDPLPVVFSEPLSTLGSAVEPIAEVATVEPFVEPDSMDSRAKTDSSVDVMEMLAGINLELTAPASSSALIETVFATDEPITEDVSDSISHRENEPTEAPVSATVLHLLPPAPVPQDDVRRIGHLNISLPLYNIFLAEADELLRTLARDFSEWRHELDRNSSETACRAAHSLAGSSATVGLDAVHDLASAIERVLLTSAHQAIAIQPEELDLLDAGLASLRAMLHRFAAQFLPDADTQCIADLDRLRDQLSWREQVDAATSVAPALPEPSPEEMAAQQVSTQVSTPEIESPAELVPTAFVPQALEPVFSPIEHSADASLVNETVTGSTSDFTPNFNSNVTSNVTAFESTFEPTFEPILPTPIGSNQSTQAQVPNRASIAEELEASEVRDDIDPELMAIFVQEANDTMPLIGGNLRDWQSNPARTDIGQALLRQLHTVKGSARMAGAMRLGELMHAMETRVESGSSQGRMADELFEELLNAYEHGMQLLHRLAHPETAPQAKVGSDAEAVAAETPQTFSSSVFDPPSQTRAAPEFERRKKARANMPAGPMVRVRADLLDRVVNQAGEVSISRARLENEVGQIRVSLGDLTDNLARLRAQLREIEMQAESQMQSQLSMVKEQERFDPLEFDRFTRFQELTRMMAESVNDVEMVRKNLMRSLDGTSRSLSTQKRMTRDMQQDLMRVRMVPFSSVTDRLYRVVRQASKELDKRATLDITGSSVEMDRALLEQMAGPFEHLLRNAIVHGIENRDVRRSAGKPEIGELMVEVRHEGNEIVLIFSDDGAGLNLDKIRERGYSLGLIAPDEKISDEAASELIFQSGFTTATQVTELAGRGVGMDVVRAEATALGGRVTISSESGKGTQFAVHLPLTLAVTQAVVVRSAGRLFALPAVLVDAVLQVKPEDLAEAYQAGQMSWQGKPAKVHFLSRLLGDATAPMAQRYSPVLMVRSSGTRMAVHVDEVIGNQEAVVKNLGPQLARMAGIAGATVLGTGEVVLILNPVQIAQRMQSAAAAHTTSQAMTDQASSQPQPHDSQPANLLDDAAAPSVGVNMDAARDALQEAARIANLAPPKVQTGTLPGSMTGGLETMSQVMVVDDSLTVRRVTQRLLMREGYQVVLAKDGIDALQQMEDFVPDVMLVDIEMPRMDGFDLTRHIREDARYKHIPIIMITSRTADKHRSFAMELGVNVYLGKPYQDEELLTNIRSFVEQRKTGK